MNIKGGLHPTCDNHSYSYNNLLTNIGVNEETKKNTKPRKMNYYIFRIRKNIWKLYIIH